MILDNETQREMLRNALDDPALRVPAPLVREFVALLDAIDAATIADPEPAE